MLVRILKPLGFTLAVVLAGCVGQEPLAQVEDGTLVVPAYVSYHAAFRERGSISGEMVEFFNESLSVQFVGGMQVPDETGAMRNWTALTAVAAADGWAPTVDYLLLGDGAGCPRAAGYEASMGSIENQVETRSRYTDYLLGDARQVERALEHGIPSVPLILWFGLALHGAQADPANSLSGLLPHAEVAASENEATLQFRQGRPESEDHDWTLHYEFMGGTRNPFPERVRLTETKGGIPQSAGELRLEATDGFERKMQFTCPRAVDWSAARVQTQWLTEEDVPTSYSLPSEYPMREAFEDAERVPEVVGFRAAHPDTRLLEMHSFGYPIQNALGESVTAWDVTFASPGDGLGIEVAVSRATFSTNDVSAPRPYRAYEPGPIPEGFPVQPIWSTKPLIRFEDALELAHAGGLDNPNRSGWNEPPWSTQAQWRFDYYNPQYGNDPNATRTSYWMSAETGWLMWSAFNVQPWGVFDGGG